MTTGSVAPELPGLPGCCSTCPFWLGLKYAEKAACRRNPPYAGAGVEKAWPLTLRSDWCGEHPARREGKNPAPSLKAVLEAVKAPPPPRARKKP